MKEMCPKDRVLHQSDESGSHRDIIGLVRQDNLKVEIFHHLQILCVSKSVILNFQASFPMGNQY